MNDWTPSAGIWIEAAATRTVIRNNSFLYCRFATPDRHRYRFHFHQLLGFASRPHHAFGALKVEVKQVAMQSASQVVLVASSSKYGTFSMYRIAGVEQFDIILSDDALPPAAADSIRKQGVELLLPSDSNV